MHVSPDRSIDRSIVPKLSLALIAERQRTFGSLIPLLTEYQSELELCRDFFTFKINIMSEKWIHHPFLTEVPSKFRVNFTAHMMDEISRKDMDASTSVKIFSKTSVVSSFSAIFFLRIFIIYEFAAVRQLSSRFVLFPSFSFFSGSPPPILAFLQTHCSWIHADATCLRSWG